MSNRNILQALQSAGGAGGATLDVDDVFSTHLYDGTGANQTITNNIDLSGEGGLVWLKSRNGSSSAFHTIYDTERGTGPNGGRIFGGTASTNGESTQSDGLQSFNSNGFTLGANLFENGTNASYGTEYCSWTFRKAPKFFDVVTWTGTGSSRTISHNLGSVPGMIIIKCTSHTGNWSVWHRSVTSPNSNWWRNYGILSSTMAFADWGNDTGLSSEPTSTAFSLGSGLNDINASGRTYVAYLFAHNNSDGEFGPDSDQDVIKCGSYSGSTTNKPSINLGFEPQWVMIKASNTAESWAIFDNMRGVATGGNDAYLLADTSDAEDSGANWVDFTSTGFNLTINNSRVNADTVDYIYMAIRRGSLNTPVDATKVFAISTFGQAGDSKSPAYRSTFPVDMSFETSTAGFSKFISSRLTGNKYMKTDTNAAEVADSVLTYDHMNGVYTSTGTLSAYYRWMWKRAPGYFDVVCYDGDGATSQNVSHNLGVAPEMMWVKRRSGASSAASEWQVYHKDLTNASYYLILNQTYAQNTNSDRWNSTAPTASVFTVGISDTVNKNTGAPNYTATPYIAYLFATVGGVSKVGSYTGTNSTLNVDCGFSNGARFVLLKRIDSGDSWLLHDSARGIVSGNDPYLYLNNTLAQQTGYDPIDPLSSGFTLNGGGFNSWNASGGTYIFYAIA